MRAIAACQFTLSQFTLWRAFVLLLSVGAVLSVFAWSLGRLGTWDGPAVAVLGIVGVAAVGSKLARVGSASLRWDGRCWHLGPADAAGREPTAGSLAVVMDLGGWMLLRFRDEAPKAWFATTWLPVQRRGSEPHWHALRCAVYSPRPAVDAVDAVDADAAADL